MDTGQSPTWRARLRKALMDHFSESDIKSLCFDLTIDYEQLSGENKTEKVISLIAYCDQTDTIPQLIQWCSRHRPNVAWDEIEAAAIQEENTQKPLVIPSVPAPEKKRNITPWFSIGGIVIIIILLTILVVNLISRSNEPKTTSIQTTTSFPLASPTINITQEKPTTIPEESSPISDNTPTQTTESVQIEQKNNLGSGLKVECIHADVWTVHPGESANVDSKNCWQLANNSISAKDDGLTFFIDQPEEEMISGIYTEIDGNAIIDFDIRIDKLQTSANDVLSNIAIGIVPNNLALDSGKFIIYQKESPVESYPVFLKHEERGDFDSYMTQEGEFIRYSLGSQDHVTMRLVGDVLNIFRNGQKVAGPLDVAYRERVLWIGYRVALDGAIEADISGLTIQE